MFHFLKRKFHFNSTGLARKPPSRIDKHLNLPSDFDIIADDLLAKYDPMEQNVDFKPKPKNKPALDKIHFNGIDEELFDGTKEIEESAQDLQIKLSKIANKKEENYEADESFDSLIMRMEKVDVNEYYDQRHEFGESTLKEDTNWFENKVYNSTPQDTTPRWLKGVERGLKRQQGKNELEFDKSMAIGTDEIVNLLESNAAFNITVIDTSEKCDHVDAVIICEGRSTTHIYSLADSVKRLV
jgi:hypothetical protein